MSISTLTITKEYDDGTALTEAQLDAMKTSIESWAGQVAARAPDKSGTESISGIWTLTTPKITGAGAGVATVQYENSGSSRTLTIPADADDTFVTLTATQTLTAKTLTSPTLGGTVAGSPTVNGTWTSSTWTLAGNIAGTPTFSGAVTHLAPVAGMIDKGNSGTGTITCDCATGSKFLITATGNFTLAFSNFTNGQRVEVWILQDGTGSRTVTWPTAVRWLNSAGTTNSTTDAPTLTTTANKFDVIFFEKFDAVGTDGLLFAFIKGFTGAIT